MHLVYQALNKRVIPAILPPELQNEFAAIPVKQELPIDAPFVAEFPDEIPPPIAQPLPIASWTDSTIIKPASQDWVVSHIDKARFDAMFMKSDLDHDGLVSGGEIKDVFLQSGIPNMCLAQIWALCDTNQSGKLNCEQFALAMWFVEQKQKGIDPPDQLAPNMIPPNLRTTTTSKVNEAIAAPILQPVREAYSNPELEIIHNEIEKITSERTKLEREIAQKEADIRIKNGEVKSLQVSKKSD